MFSRLIIPIALLLGLLMPATAWAGESAILVDNSTPAASSTGEWSHANYTPGSYGDGYQFRVAGSGANTFFWPFTGPEGDFEVYVRWTAGPNRASDATYTIKHQAGESSATVDQKTGGGAWRRIGVFKFRPGVGHGVILSDKANGVVVADAVLFSPPGVQVQEPARPAPSPQPAAATPTPQPSPQPTPQTTAQATPPPLGATPAINHADPRYFPQTRYAITEDRFWDYFQKRGGLGTFGFPISHTFTLLGTKVQVFQRQIMQLSPDGGVSLMNLLDEGLMPYTRINGSTFPAPDPEVIKLHPSIGESDYHLKALEFVREHAPDSWNGLPVNFFQAFSNTVRYEDAFSGGDGDKNLVPGFNLEIWGLPTSRPAFDPANKGFVYLRFQRGILHYDDACKCTQALLLADYLKSLMLGHNVPPDLLEQARGSRFFAQYNSEQPLGLNRPQQLGGSDLRGAFLKAPTVTIDAGHGGKEIGSSHIFPDGTRLMEKDLNLKVARKVAAALRQAGYHVVETRTADTAVNDPPRDLTGDGTITISDDLQARVDIANNAQSDLLLSIHFNGLSDPEMRGTYVYYNAKRPFSNRSKGFAEMIGRHLVKRLNAAGYQTIDRGVRTDASALGGGHYFYLLGPQSHIIKRESKMPAALAEALFLTNPSDANALREERVLDAIAQAYVEAVKEYSSRYEVN